MIQVISGDFRKQARYFIPSNGTSPARWRTDFIGEHGTRTGQIEDRLRCSVWMCSAGMGILAAGTVFGQDFPNRVVRMVVAEAGGGNDFIARAIAPGLGTGLGQQVIVDNRGGGIIPAQTVAKAAPDGYTLLLASGTLWILSLMRDTPYDPIRDYLPITLAVISPNVLIVHPSLPVKCVRDLIALAQSKPGELNYASSATGGSGHLAAELFKAMAHVNIVRISYRGNGPALNDMISGQVQVMFSNAASSIPHVKSGRLKALAVTTALPSALLPGLPAVAASGLPGYETAVVFGIFAPARTPAPIAGRLNLEAVRAINKADIKDKFLGVGVEPVGSTAEDFAAKIKSEMSRMRKVIVDAGIRAD